MPKSKYVAKGFRSQSHSERGSCRLLSVMSSELWKHFLACPSKWNFVSDSHCVTPLAWCVFHSMSDQASRYNGESFSVDAVFVK